MATVQDTTAPATGVRSGDPRPKRETVLEDARRNLQRAARLLLVADIEVPRQLVAQKQIRQGLLAKLPTSGAMKRAMAAVM